MKKKNPTSSAKAHRKLKAAMLCYVMLCNEICIHYTGLSKAKVRVHE